MRQQIFEILRSIVLKGAQPAQPLTLCLPASLMIASPFGGGWDQSGHPLPVPVTPGPRTGGLEPLRVAMTVATARITPRIGYDRFLMWNMNKRLA